jgi:hypothetical protein
MAAVSQDDFLNDSSQFDLARRRAQQQSASNTQARRDALSRRFASLGNLDSGARVKLEQKAMDEEAQNLNQANEGIDAQQQAEMQRRKEILQSQQFQAGEAEKGRSFSSEQAAMQRAFQKGERVGSQDFQAGESALTRGQQERQFNKTFDFTEDRAKRADKQFDMAFDEEIRRDKRNFIFTEDRAKRADKEADRNMEITLDQLSTAKDQFDRTFAEEVRINDANLVFAERASKEKGFLEGLGSNFSFGGDTSSKLKNTAHIIGAAIGGPVGYASSKQITNIF